MLDAKVPMSGVSTDVSVSVKPTLGRRREAPVVAVYDAALWCQATRDSLLKFDPRIQVRNPVMFVVWVGAVVTAALAIDPQLFGPSDASMAYNGVVTVILVLTVWFANFAEALAEGRGKAKAASLRRTKTELTANRVLASGANEQVLATVLRKGELVRVERQELIPADGEVLEGVAFVSEAAITGESAPVLKEPGTDMHSSVTAGTLLISDQLLIRVTADPGESFLDRMIHLVEGARRQKTPNELALTALLAILTLILFRSRCAACPFGRPTRRQPFIAT
jgi:potassium-transporting ATPase ATP-binding subunit